MSEQDAEVAVTVAAIESAADHRWGVWLSDTGWWWAARTEPLSARDLGGGGIPYLHADSPDELIERIREQDRLNSPHVEAGRKATAADTSTGRCGVVSLPQRGRISRASFGVPLSTPSQARRHTAAALRAWELPSETIDTAKLVVSESTTNAVRASIALHADLDVDDRAAANEVSLTLRLLHDRLVIEVGDNSPNPPVFSGFAGADSEAGRGLMLVESLSKEWGYFCSPAGGKIVFCVLGMPGIHERTDSEILGFDSDPEGPSAPT